MRFTILALLCCVTVSLAAQVDSLTTFQVGLGGGQYFSSVNFNFQPRRSGTSFVPLPTTHFGAGIRYFNRRSAGFIAELNYTGGGWREELTEVMGMDTITENYQRQLSYLELQLLTQFTIGRKRMRPFLEGGPYLAIPFSEKETLPATVAVPGGYYFGEDINSRFNYGVLVGLGVYVDFNQLAFQLGGRYLAGVRDILTPGENGVSISRRQAIGWRFTAWYKLQGN